MTWELKPDRPIYLQLAEQISRLIVSGGYMPGDKLPSVRDLATDASVNPNTMQKALAELERSGLVFSNRTSGRFITEDKNMINDMKKDLAKKELNEFLERMLQLGLNRQEIITLILEDEIPSENRNER